MQIDKRTKQPVGLQDTVSNNPIIQGAKDVIG